MHLVDVLLEGEGVQLQQRGAGCDLLIGQHVDCSHLYRCRHALNVQANRGHILRGGGDGAHTTRRAVDDRVRRQRQQRAGAEGGGGNA